MFHPNEKPTILFALAQKACNNKAYHKRGTGSMEKPYTFFQDIRTAVETIPTESIVSRTISREGGMKVIVFAFAPGQELSEHTASVPAVIQILQGEADLTVGSDRYDAQPGTWVRMDANLSHSIYARTPVIMLLIMLDKTA
jgi:quercetin dioxygenase-like cupin family protein